MNGSDSQKLQGIASEVSSSIETEGGTKYAETEFWISNRIAPLIGQNVNQTLRKTKKFEANLLVEAQEYALEKSHKIPKLLFRATWVFCPAWFLFMIFVIFAWGVSMDSDATELPKQELVVAATSNCTTRKMDTPGASFSVDVHGRDFLNLQGAQYRANELNDNFERYGNNLGFKTPSMSLLPEDVSESYRFVASSVTSCAAGTVVL